MHIIIFLGSEIFAHLGILIVLKVNQKYFS